MYIKFLFELHWLHVRDDMMAKAEDDQDENEVRVWYLLRKGCDDIDTL